MNDVPSVNQRYLRLAEVVSALSLATDLGTGQPLERALRTCLLAFRLGESIGLSDHDLHTVYYVALLRFVGCTADAEHLFDIFGDERVGQARVSTVELLPMPMIAAILKYAGDGYPLSERIRKITYGLTAGISRTREAQIAHCEVSQNIARHMGLGQDVDLALAQIYERWDGRGHPGKVKGDALATAIRLLHLAQDAEVFSRLGGIETALDMARQRAGGFYDPIISDQFIRHGTTLLAELEADSIQDVVLALEPEPRFYLSESELDTAARAIADFTDLRTAYTFGHSSAVADLAYAAACCARLAPDDTIQIRRAGYLHDVGRTSISLAIWNKPGALTNAEWERVRLYPYYTERILARSAPLAPAGTLAALHRERLDGSGYHRGLPGAMLPFPARILAAADVYRSKIEPRAYRPALTPEAAADELQRQVKAGKLDAAAVEAVLKSAAGSTAHVKRENIANLSEREIEVLRLLAHGLSTRKIAETLFISPKTADHHIQHIYNKIGVSTRAAAALFAMQNGLLEA